jgi:phospholipid/cholesterol/gamma-HCH transport system substrate-binding protein
MSNAFRVGAFVVASLLILAAGIFSVGGKSSLLHRSYSLRAEFSNVAGLNEGAEVRVGGIRQGSVRRMILPKSPKGKVTVVLDLDSGTRQLVKRDSVAAINSEGLLGDKYVEVSFGSEEAPSPKDGDTIPSENPRDISDLVKSAGVLLDSTNDTMRNVQSISSKIDQGQGTIGALINDRHLYEGVRTATAKAADGAASFTDDMDALKHNFLLRGFFKKRGYEDSAELTAHAIPRLPAAEAVKTFTLEGEQLFSGKEEAKLKGEAKLKEVGHFLEGAGHGFVVITDRCSHIGDEKKGLVLSQARALVVRDYLAKNFKLEDAQLKTMGKGEANGGEESKVEILVYSVADASAGRQAARK